MRLAGVLRVLLAAALAGCTARTPPPVALTPSGQSAGVMPGWGGDRVAEALPSFLRSCAVLARMAPGASLGGQGSLRMTAGEFRQSCAAAAAVPPGDEAAARAFFQRSFTAVSVGEDQLTGYYEPELRGSLTRSARFNTPLHRMPTGRPLPPRANIVAGALDGRGLEIVWVDDPVDAFFLQVQGSGRVTLTDGRVLRLGYAGQNGQPYYAIGRALVARGVMTVEEASMQSIRAWMHGAGPAEAMALMARNPSYVFFRVLDSLGPETGPLGALGAPLTPGRTVAVDRSSIPLGAPVWLVGEGGRIQRMVVAQDTGGAIRGAARADLFTGWGEAAGQEAGLMRGRASLWVMRPSY